VARVGSELQRRQPIVWLYESQRQIFSESPRHSAVLADNGQAAVGAQALFSPGRKRRQALFWAEKQTGIRIWVRPLMRTKNAICHLP
jgi:hypothetical protein